MKNDFLPRLPSLLRDVVLLGLALAPLTVPADDQAVANGKFVNPIGEGADPWVVRDEQNLRYLWCMSEGNQAITIQTSDRLTSLGTKHVVWQAPDSGPYSREIWAPELHFLDGRWHIYFAASNGQNKNHLTYVLRSKTEDALGAYDLHGPLATGEGADGRSPNVWAIDMTVLERGEQRYAIWSGWDAPETDRQFLYIAPMKSPTELAGPRVRLCSNRDYVWEQTEPNDSGRGLNEGPQVFQSRGTTCVVYSCGASWLPTYKLGMLELVGDDPLNPAAWKKRPEPVFQSTEQVYGVGHSCFVKSPDGKQWWHVYHAKRDRSPGWRREIRVQPMKVDQQGFPVLGQPLDDSEVLDRPSGETTISAQLPVKLLGSSNQDVDWSYYGHHQFWEVAAKGLVLGRVPESPINAYRCGEKLVIHPALPSDLVAEVTIDFLSDPTARDAGILFRCSGASLGYDAQRSYFAGLIPKTGLVIVGKTDGKRWSELARAAVTIDTSLPQTLKVQVRGQQMAVSHNGKQQLSLTDNTYRSGSVGLRVVDTHAVFSDFQIVAPDSDPN